MCDSTEFVHSTHTMELLVQRTRTNPTRPFHRVSALPYHRHPILGSPVSSRHTCHRMATNLRMVKMATVMAKLVPNGDWIHINKLSLKTIVAYWARVTARA